MGILHLIENEKWSIVTEKEKNGRLSYKVKTPYEDDIGLLKLQHPAYVHLDIYSKHSSAEVRFQHLKNARGQLWPDRIWHDWTRRRYEAHCENYNFIVQAAGASAGKSYDWAEIGTLFYFPNPLENNVTIASTTLASLKGRVWGYVTASVQSMAIQPDYVYTSSPTPQILPVVPKEQLKATGRGKIEGDTLHGMFAVTAKRGDSNETIATWIGKHPKNKLLLVLDEGTDMPIAILDAVPNLNSHPEKFQMAVIGNSDDTQDLHGLMATPKAGWSSVSTELIEWSTTQQNGICQYFNPYDSPAITDPDPEKRKILSKFLISKEILETKEKELGVDSEKFYRWVLGFWKSRDSSNIIVSEKFLKDFSPQKHVNWSGYYPIQKMASLDFAISTGGDNCLLRIANVGQDITGKVKLDLGNTSGLFYLELKRLNDKSFELQIADQVIDILQKYGILLEHLTIDVTGQGRAIGEVIRLRNEARGFPLGRGNPLKIYAMSQHNLNKNKKSAPDVIPMSTYALWKDIRELIDHDTIRNMDDKATFQLTNRIIEKKGDKEVMESKESYKKRMGAVGVAHSPDEADSVALIIQTFKQRLGLTADTMWKVPQAMTRQFMDKMFAQFGEQTQQKSIQVPTARFGNTSLIKSVKFGTSF